MLRILFIQIAFEDRPEYTDHRLLAKYADPTKVECYFIWQKTTNPYVIKNHQYFNDNKHHFYLNFGRSKNTGQTLPRWKRAFSMAWNFPGSLLFLLKIIRQIKPDVIYTSQQRFDILLVTVVQLFFKLPHLIHLHYTVGPWLGKRTLRTILNSTHLLAVSNFICKQAIERGVPPSNVDTIYNPIDVARFNIPRNSGAIRQAFNWTAQTPLVVSAGRLDPFKGFEMLLDAFAILHKNLPEARLLICGETYLTTGYDLKLKRKATSLGLDGCVVFAGWRPDLPLIFSEADVFCLAAQEEPFGLVFGEAMIAGLPVVACNSGAVPELVVDGETGFITELNAVDALASNLLRLLTDKTLACQMGHAGRKRAFEKFDPEVIAQEWVTLMYKHFNRNV